jgi:hypothetical protein
MPGLPGSMNSGALAPLFYGRSIFSFGVAA